ncbi:MAG: hypothetical protein ACI4XR_04050 [Bacilli bacterium]
MKEQIVSIITLTIFLIGAFFCYKKVQKVDTIEEKQNSLLFINYDNNIINANIDINDDKTILKSKAFVNYESPIDDEVCLNIYLIGGSNYTKTDGVDRNNKELTFKMIYNDEVFKEEKEISSFIENEKIVLEQIKVKANTKDTYEIITSFYINNLDQNHLVNNNIIFTYNFEKVDC